MNLTKEYEALSDEAKQNLANLIRSIAPGDRVTILVPNGIGRHGPEYKQKTGRAVICNHVRNPNDLTVALNMGGPHGTPGVASVTNIVKVSRAPAQSKRRSKTTDPSED
jgi:hypothetical protein